MKNAESKLNDDFLAQTAEAHRANAGIHTISYRQDGHGHCLPRQDEGWQPMNEVNWQAWRHIEQQVEASRRQVEAGYYSPLHYYMTINQMSVFLLAQYAKQPLWKALLHLRPFFFQRLSPSTLKRYAEIFCIPVADLAAGVLGPAVYQRRGVAEKQDAT